VNGAVLLGTAQEFTGLDVTNVMQATSSAVLHGSTRE
jgi:hypothetical protein